MTGNDDAQRARKRGAPSSVAVRGWTARRSTGLSKFLRPQRQLLLKLFIGLMPEARRAGMYPETAATSSSATAIPR
jgi:hypothetical protein